MSQTIFMVLNPIFCYVSPTILIFHEPLIVETSNKCHWIQHASNLKYMPLKQFQCIFPSQNQQNVKFLPEIVIFQDCLLQRLKYDSKPAALDSACLEPKIHATQAISMHFPSHNQQNVKYGYFLNSPWKKKLKKCQFAQGKSVCKGFQSAHIGFWIYQLQCTMSELCVTSTFWVIMVFLHFYGKVKI